MNTRAVIALALAGFLAPTASAGGVPTTFARSGSPVAVAVTVGDDSTPGNVVLRVFGRTWTEPAAVVEGKARIETPAVRVPTVFSVVPPDEPDRPCGYLVAYPKTDPLWDPERVHVYAASPPRWFAEWAEAAGAPVVRTTLEELKVPDLRQARLTPRLLVVGREAAGEGFEDVAAIGKKYRINVLILEAGWLPPATEARVEVVPDSMDHVLGHFRRQRWAEPIVFPRRVPPWLGIVNRRAWIHGPDGLPLVEETALLSGGWRVDLSYVPWADVLGRSELADTLFAELLEAAARRPQLEEILGGRVMVMMHPPAEGLESTDRPVLAVAASSPSPYRSPVDPKVRLSVVDLRGQAQPAREVEDALQRWDTETSGRLLILGDDPLLDRLKWLRLDRSKGTAVGRAGQPRVEWLPDDALPPSAEAQVRLMEVLTEFGVRLVVPSKEESK